LTPTSTAAFRDVDALGRYWAVFPSLHDELFRPNDRPGYLEPKVPSQQVKATILNHPEFHAYKQRVAKVFDTWRKAHEPRLRSLQQAVNPKEVIRELSEDLLVRFAELPLLSRYDVYQRMMDYWDDVMQDDVYMIAADGWAGAARPQGIAPGA
jgi:type I restriction enzyme M protein